MKTAVEDLKPHPLNAEIYQLSGIEDLAESIEQVGLLEPLVVNTEILTLLSSKTIRLLAYLTGACQFLLRKLVLMVIPLLVLALA